MVLLNEKGLNLKDPNYNEAIIFLAYLINFPTDNKNESTNKMQKQCIIKISDCFKKGFLLDPHNYEIYLYEICHMLLLSKNSREVLLFFLCHQPGEQLPSFQKMREMFPSIPPKPSRRKGFHKFSHAVSFFLDFMAVESQKMAENIKKNKFLINTKIFQEETINLMVKHSYDIFNEKIQLYLAERKIKENGYTAIQAEFYENKILNLCELIHKEYGEIFEYIITKAKSEKFPSYFDIHEKFGIMKSESNCQNTIAEFYNLLDGSSKMLPTELSYDNILVLQFQEDSRKLVLIIATKKKEETIEKKQLIQMMMKDFTFNFE